MCKEIFLHLKLPIMWWMNAVNKSVWFLLRFINSVKNALWLFWSDNCANCYFQSFVVSLLFPFADFFIFYRRQKKKKTLGRTASNWACHSKLRKRNRKKYFCCLNRSFVRSFISHSYFNVLKRSTKELMLFGFA
jgi:hypothetical protein